MVRKFKFGKAVEVKRFYKMEMMRLVCKHDDLRRKPTLNGRN